MSSEKEVNPELLSDRIKEVRAHTGLSATDFGAKIGIKKSSVSLLESGKNNPSERTILAICYKEIQTQCSG